MEKEQDFKKPEYYENRELSWLKFNHRVLNEARDKSIPLLERLKFVSITSSNLDEFFMVRVASLKDMVHANYKKKDIAGMTASEQLEKINERTRELVTLQYNTYNRSLVPLMHQHGIVVMDAFEDLSEAQAAFVDRYFEDNVYPVLTPMAVDASRPFPLIRLASASQHLSRPQHFFPRKKERQKKRKLNLQPFRFQACCHAWYISLRKMEMKRPSFYWSRSLSGILINCF